MKARLLPLLALCLAWALPALAGAPLLAPRVLGRLPHDPAAFTQGLLLHAGLLYESTGLYGQSSIRRVEPQSGRALLRLPLPGQLFGEGLALCPEGPQARLVQLTWREGLAILYDPETMRALETRPWRGEGWGLACDGGRLIASDGTDVLRLVDARTLAETGRLRVRDGRTPVRELNELEWVNGWIVANVWRQDRLAVIRPAGTPGAGQVAAWIDLAPLRRELDEAAEAANGVAFDPRASTLLVTGKRWDRIFVLALPEILATPPGR